MPTKNEIEQAHKTEHDRITRAYYVDKTLSKADFEVQHAALSAATEQVLVDNGYYVRPLPPPPSTNWKALWLAADTSAKKIAVLAKRLELE